MGFGVFAAWASTLEGVGNILLDLFGAHLPRALTRFLCKLFNDCRLNGPSANRPFKDLLQALLCIMNLAPIGLECLLPLSFVAKLGISRGFGHPASDLTNVLSSASVWLSPPFLDFRFRPPWPWSPFSPMSAAEGRFMPGIFSSPLRDRTKACVPCSSTAMNHHRFCSHSKMSFKAST